MIVDFKKDYLEREDSYYMSTKKINRKKVDYSFKMLYYFFKVGEYDGRKKRTKKWK